MARRFIDIEMPDEFVLECLTPSGRWIAWGWYEAAALNRLDDGTYVCGGHVGSPLYLRCLRQDGDVIYVLDGTGQPFTYRLVSKPSPHRRPRAPNPA